MLGYTRRFRRQVVICKNVSGLLKRAYGCDALIHLARMAFDEMGHHKVFWSLSDARASGCGLFGLT